MGSDSHGGSQALDAVDGPLDIVTPILPQKDAANTWLGGNDFSGASFMKLRRGVGAPVDPAQPCASTTDVAGIYVRSDARASGQSLYICAQTAPNIYGWELIP